MTNNTGGNGSTNNTQNLNSTQNDTNSDEGSNNNQNINNTDNSSNHSAVVNNTNTSSQNNSQENNTNQIGQESYIIYLCPGMIVPNLESGPFFITELLNIINLSAGSNNTYKFPEVCNYKNTSLYNLKIDLLFQESLPGYINYNNTHLDLTPPFGINGQSYLIVTLSSEFDDFIVFNQYMIELNITSRPHDNKAILEPSINQTDYKRFDENFSMTITEISTDSYATIEFSKPIVVPKNFNKLLKQSLSISFGSDFESYNVLDSFDVQSFDGKILKIKLNFIDQYSISSGFDSDKLIIQITNNKLFMAKDTNLPILSNFQSQRVIPQQTNEDQDEIDNQKQTNQIITDILSASIYSGIIIGTFSGTSLQMLWGFINTLQLITHTPLFQIHYTLNILLFLQAVFDVVNLDPYKIEEQIKWLFNLKPSEEYEPYNDLL
ncbi:UNKNOWN [Stylonychia lemnae]|uniref:Uncharacterized protein n=1 Tax=Stylonychia lemnae TaxID=5949 RepID=A0A078A1Y3_STYLE|nr:UNKNOWN [Stylonychia lemnae]|eukprot:CDW74799.1 UNKNOWN [Stylonychia lemnae]